MTDRSLFDHSERFPIVALIVAAVIAAGGLYLILHRAAPIVTAPAPAPKPAPQAAPPVMTAPAAQPPVQAAVPPGPVVYRCIVNGTTTYSDAPCPGGKRIDATPAAKGYAMPRGQLSATVPVADEERPARAAANAEKARRDARCAWIEKAIEAIDAQARQGLPVVEQDRLRADRARLVDERYALKC